LYLNNVDIDLADDLRRSVTRSVAEFDAPQLGLLGELHGPSSGVLLPNPYRVAVAEHDLRKTNVSFLQYQVIPIVVLIVISVGVPLLPGRRVHDGGLPAALAAGGEPLRADQLRDRRPAPGALLSRPGGLRTRPAGADGVRGAVDRAGVHTAGAGMEACMTARRRLLVIV